MYLALARKYRPQKFSELIGQPSVVKTLQNALEMNKLYPALIFSGMKGVGKTSAARILAKTLSCENGPGREPCNECDVCCEITQDKSSDYIEIDGASNNGVEEVRRLRETVKYKPLKNRFRVVVIDEVHMLSNSAWNALLKTIEEPPEHTYFIMATTDFHKIPATIVSRCQHFEFKRIPLEIIADLLKKLCKKEKITVSEYSVYLIARAAEGSLRDAKKILDQAIAISSGNIKDDDVVDILGIIEEEIFLKLTGWVFGGERREIICSIRDLSEKGTDLRYFFMEYLKFLRDLIVIKCMKDPGDLHNINPDNIPAVTKLLENTGEIELIRYFNAAKDMEITMRHTENPRIILEYLFLKLSYFPGLVPIENILDSMKNGQPAAQKITARGTAFSEKQARPQSEKKVRDRPVAVIREMSGTEIKQFWLKKSTEKNPRLATALNNSRIRNSQGAVEVIVDGDKAFSITALKENADVLQKTLEQRLGRACDIKIELGEDKTKKLEEEIKKDKNITDFVSKIKGKIISVENSQGGNNGENS